ncbi:MAG: sigma-54-dependent Fis family transcriptional regulator [Magnetococcales bacterium]|nr:sigma-54-dependent Fis family transcriptional regulator [Magnetococcales bacterium]MBF0322994.1 sigma-54-dependent Fis family transcriptional regulator [Magnetococcales bacterium]
MDDPPHILIVDDELITLRNLEHFLAKEGYGVQTANSGREAITLLETIAFDVVLTDLRMEKVDGMRVLQYCREKQPEAEVILLTGFATIDTAVKAMKLGAFHYITKPFKLGDVRRAVQEAIAKAYPRRVTRALREKLDHLPRLGKIITQDATMRQLLAKARDAAQTDCTILIAGESGTGKELVAQYIHQCCNHAEAPFVAVNCGAFTEELLANELFGHEKGAFTGAHGAKVGLLEAATHGTLFLDEVTEMSLAMQVKFLRVIQEREFYPIGSPVPRKINTRFIAASNRNIQRMVDNNEFRRDLFYRLNVVLIKLPRLCERKSDIGPLTIHFLTKHAASKNKPQIRHISGDVMDVLKTYPFPGNIRELENIIEQGVVLAKGTTLEMSHLPEDMQQTNWATIDQTGAAIPSLEEHEIGYIRWVLGKTNGNKTRAAALLGIDRASLWRKLKRHGVQ